LDSPDDPDDRQDQPALLISALNQPRHRPPLPTALPTTPTRGESPEATSSVTVAPTAEPTKAPGFEGRLLGRRPPNRPRNRPRIFSRPSSEHAPARSPTSTKGTTMRCWRRLMRGISKREGDAPDQARSAPPTSTKTVTAASMASSGHTHRKYRPYGTRAIARPPMTTADVGMNRFISPLALW
jgi:hypothetical protein